MALTQLQKDFIDDPRDRGASVPTLIAVGTVVKHPEAIREMAARLWEIEDREDQLVTEQEILRTLMDTMNEANVTVDSEDEEDEENA